MTSESASKTSTLKDLVVTAAVATVVSALVSPWIRRWTEPQASTDPSQVPPSEAVPDDVGVRIERLLEVPNSFPTIAMTSPRQERGLRTRRRTDDDDSDDREP